MNRDLRPRRILYLINDLALGGAQRVLAAQATRLERSLFVPEVASLELIPDGPVTFELERAGLPVHRLLAPGEPPARALPRLVKLLRRGRYDLLHAHLAAADVAGTLAACCVDVPAMVTTLHNLRDWEEGSGGPLRWVERRTLLLCDQVVCVSLAVRAAVLRRLPALAPRTVVIRNGVDLARIEGAAARRAMARAAWGFPEDAFVIGAVARLDAAKGLEVLLEAAARAAREVDSLRVLVAGDGAAKARLEILARGLRLERRTVFAGMLEDVRDALGALDLFVAPSRTEGLGLALLEAQAAGVPVLGARVGGIPEVVGNGVSGELVDGHDPAMWAARIVGLARDRGTLALRAAAAPGWARRHSVTTSVAALERLYVALLERPREEREAA